MTGPKIEAGVAHYHPSEQVIGEQYIGEVPKVGEVCRFGETDRGWSGNEGLYGRVTKVVKIAGHVDANGVKQEAVEIKFDDMGPFINTSFL